MFDAASYGVGTAICIEKWLLKNMLELFWTGTFLDEVIYSDWLSAHLFQLFQPKSQVLKKASPKSPFDQYKTQLFGKSCILYLWRECARWIWSSLGPFYQKPVRVFIYPLGWAGQLPNYPSINHPHVFAAPEWQNPLIN